MILTQTVAPTEEPIELEDARVWCGFQQGVRADDKVVEDLISEIRGYLEERWKHRKLITQTWTIGFDYSEIGSEIRIPIVPLRSVSKIEVYDDDGNASIVGASNYQVRIGEDPRVVLSPSGSWPSMRAYDSMVITATVGYGLRTALPEDLRMLLKGLIQHQYRSKGFGVTETEAGNLISIPSVFERQIRSLKVEPWA
jgi:uncharacterized phiE125 gp8 family phage protein